MPDATSEVTAQRVIAAFNAVQDVLDLIESRREDLQAIASGRSLVERADATRRAFAEGPA